MIIREATVNDVDAMLGLINSYASKGLMLAKTRYKLFSSIQNFFVAEEENIILGCVSLNVIWGDLAEICSLAVSEKNIGYGIGRALVEKCLLKAKGLKIPRVIALTYQDKFFEKLGFKFTNKDNYPRKLWRECLECPKLEECDELAYIYEFKTH